MIDEWLDIRREHASDCEYCQGGRDCLELDELRVEFGSRKVQSLGRQTPGSAETSGVAASRACHERT